MVRVVWKLMFVKWNELRILRKDEGRKHKAESTKQKAGKWRP